MEKYYFLEALAKAGTLRRLRRDVMWWRYDGLILKTSDGDKWWPELEWQNKKVWEVEDR